MLVIPSSMCERKQYKSMTFLLKGRQTTREQDLDVSNDASDRHKHFCSVFGWKSGGRFLCALVVAWLDTRSVLGSWRDDGRLLRWRWSTRDVGAWFVVHDLVTFATGRRKAARHGPDCFLTDQ